MMLRRHVVVAVLAATMVGGCSTSDIVGDAITGGGNDVFATDNDPQLVREAIPFGLKVYESVLAGTPKHRGLLLACARGFTAYAFLVQKEADRLEARDLEGARARRARASRLYRRGRDYALRGLDAAHEGFTARLRTERDATLAATDADDVPFLYWAGAAWAGALSARKDDLELVAELPLAGALVRRVLTLDENFEAGSAHEFFISYEAGRPGGSVKLARDHYRRALELSRGRRASAHIALAESVSIKQQDLKEFRALLDRVLTTDPDAAPEFRLVNTIARERAIWLKSRIPDLFVAAGETG